MNPTAAMILMSGLLIIGCSKTEDAAVTTTGSTAAAPKTTAVAAPVTAAAAVPAAAAAGDVEVSPEMKAFMAMLDGKDDSAGKALKKYAAKGKEKDDLGMYTLMNPKVTKSEKVGALQCYTMTSKAGAMDHVSKLCWNAAGKIAEITDSSS